MSNEPRLLAVSNDFRACRLDTGNEVYVSDTPTGSIAYIRDVPWRAGEWRTLGDWMDAGPWLLLWVLWAQHGKRVWPDDLVPDAKARRDDHDFLMATAELGVMA